MNLDALTIECFNGSWSATCDASATRVRATTPSAGPGVSKTFTILLTVDPTATTGTKVFGTGSLTSNELPDVPAASVTPIRVNLCPGALEAGVFFDPNQNGLRDPGERFLPNWLFDLTDERPETSTIGVDLGGLLSIALSRGTYTWNVRRDGDPTQGIFRIVDTTPPTPQVLNVCPDVVTTLEVPVVCDCEPDGDPCTDDICNSFGACSYVPRTEPRPGVLDDTCDYVDDDCDGQLSEDWVAPLVAECPDQGGCAGVGGVTECIDNWLYVSGCNYIPAPEVCDGIDNNCDWIVDNGTFPAEICDGVDNNCDGTIDNGTFPAELCNGVDDDCDGLTDLADPSMPRGEEMCDGRDNDCDGLVDALDPSMAVPACEQQSGVCQGAQKTRSMCVTVDYGWGAFTQWDFCGPAQYLPHAFYNFTDGQGLPASYSYYDWTCDGVDNNCDGRVDEAYFGEPTTCGVGVCVSQGQMECFSFSGPEFGTIAYESPVCTPNSAAITDEICDGLDNDCDGLVDQLDPDLVVPDCESELGVCADRKKPLALCAADLGWQSCGPADYAYVAFPDYRLDNDCDGEDNDCDGVADDGFVGYPVVCEGGCSALGSVACDEGVVVNTCELGDSSPELCDGNDNDCDGLVDTSDPQLGRVLCSEQRGVCNGAVKPLELCGGAAGWGDCSASDYAAHGFPAYAVNDAVCDGLDNDCNGAVDEEYVGQLQLCPQGSCQPVARDACVGGSVVSGCEPTGPGCPTGPGNECEDCDPEVALTVYGIAEDAAGVPRGSFRCTSSQAGLLCDTDANGFLEITDALWCGP